MKHKLYATLAVLAFNIIAIFAIRALVENSFYGFAGILAVIVIYADIMFYNDIKDLDDE